MSMMTFGEDIMAVLIATGLVIVFVTVLGSSFSAHQEKKNSIEEFQLLLNVSDYLGGGDFSGGDNGFEPGILSQEILQEKLPLLIERLTRQGIQIGVEIASLNGNLLFSSEVERENFSRSISVPVVYDCGGEKTPARLVVWIKEDSI